MLTPAVPPRRSSELAKFDGMAQRAVFRSLPAPLSERLADHAIVGAYVAWGDEPDILPMFAGVTEAGPLALPHHAARIEAMDFRRWRPGEPLEKGPWSTRQPADHAALATPDKIGRAHV